MDTIGKYEIRAVLGHGSMGTVYEAVDPLIERRLAIKTMAPGLADAAEARRRFLREAEAAGRLKHRNIVTVYDVGEDRGRPFIAMELVEGRDLEALLRSGEPLSVEWKLDVLRQLCEGLDHAHQAGIVHRDVKPANIRLTPEGEVKVMDFGIASLQSSTMTRDGTVLGTIHYMAPEQLEGRAVDLRADVFAVGAIAYELFAGRRPFAAETLSQVMFRITHERADPAALLRTAYSPGLEAVILKALDPRPEGRYGSLREMHAELETVVRAAAPRLLSAAEKRVEAERARAGGHLHRALQLLHEAVELAPGDQAPMREAEAVERAIRERELQELSGLALSYAAERDLELAARIAGRLEAMAPDSDRVRRLKQYLQEETARQAADLLTATAQEHLALGNFDEARAAAEEALGLWPKHGLAREIHDRVATVLLRRHGEPLSAEEPLEPLPEGPPSSPEAARLVEDARRHLRARAPANALPLLEQAAAAEPGHPGIQRLLGLTRLEARRDEVESLTAAALDHFVRDDYLGARQAVEKALALEPANRKARELIHILAALG